MKDEPAAEFLELVRRASASAERGEAVAAFASRIGSTRGISGYMYHTVPCVLQVWLRFSDDFEGGLKEILSAGGDADTTGAILGAIIGSRVGREGLPGHLLGGIIEWPRSIAWIEQLGCAVASASAEGKVLKSPSYFFPGVIVRNALFLLIVLAHGLRRLAPPY